MSGVFNFGAGPALLHPSVIADAAAAVADYRDSGFSLLELSHRSKAVGELIDETEALLREALGLPSDYSVLFLQGGATLQFSMIPLNLLADDRTADYIDTGVWSVRAIEDAKLYGKVNIAASGKDGGYRKIPQDLDSSPNAAYLHLTSNNTIYGTQWEDFPEPEVHLVADMSSDLLSRRIEPDRFGLIYAGAQKNLGTAGVTIVVIRPDILGAVSRSIPPVLDYRVQIRSRSLYNTPPVFAIFVVNRTLRWVLDSGGIRQMERWGKEKAAHLYDEIDRNPFFLGMADPADRSRMNVCFALSPALESRSGDFLRFVEGRGLFHLKGHRLVGGFRASLYNAMPAQGVEELVTAMRDFEVELKKRDEPQITR